MTVLARRGSNRECRETAPNGFVVVAVLWILGSLATLVSIYAVYLTNAAGAVGIGRDRLQADSLVSAGLELAVYQLTSISGGSRHSSGRLDFVMGGARVSVAFQAESARIDLNAAPKELLAGLFAVLGAPPEQAGQYADRIVGWRKPPVPGASDEEAWLYRGSGRSYGPRAAPFPHIGELWLVLGLPEILIARAMPFLTIYSGRPEVNLVDAAPPIVAALPGMTSERLESVLAARQFMSQGAQDQAALETLLGPAAKYVTPEASKANRVTVNVEFPGGYVTRSEVVILVPDQDTEPYRVLSWQDVYTDPSEKERSRSRR